MSDLWSYFKSLFKTVEESSPNQPVLHEVIERSEEEKEDYERWKKTVARRRLVDWLHQQYVLFLLQPNDTDEAIDFLNTPSSKGFVVHFYQTRYHLGEITHLFDFLKEKVLSLDYRSYLSDSRTFSRQNWVETIQRHYLKPPSRLRQLDQAKTDQKYGNITIELELRNDQPRQLKFSATSYRDHKYQDAREFKELLYLVLGE